MLGFIEIGFLPVSIWDILDILIVGYLIYRVYTLLRGSVAFNIFIGTLALFGVWWLVRILNMSLLSSILDQFVSVGVILIIIIFQPEVRRFLLLVGNTTLKGRTDFLSRFISQDDKSFSEATIKEIGQSVRSMSDSKTGALIIFSNHANVESFANSGVQLDAAVTAALFESIFFKDSPLHDGAAIVSNNKVKAAGCILPISATIKLPKRMGLRHRAGVSATIGTDVIALMVSEETGRVNIARNGRLERIWDLTKVEQKLTSLLNAQKTTEVKDKA